MPNEHRTLPVATAGAPQPGTGTALFRHEALAAGRYRWFGRVQLATPPAALLSAALAVSAILALIVAAVVIEVPERVRVVGAMLPAGGLLKITAPRSGWVEELSVGNGDRVGKGQLLMHLTDHQRAPQRAPQWQGRIQSLQREALSLTQSTEAEVGALAASRLSDEHRRRLVQARLEIAQNELAILLRQSSIQDRRVQRVAALASSAMISVHAADDVRIAALQAQANVQAAKQRALSLRDELSLIDQQLESGAERSRQIHARADQRREEIDREIATSELQQTVQILAPDSGAIAALHVRQGSYAKAGQVLLTLYDPADRLDAFLYLSANRSGVLQPGATVELQLRSFPHQVHGTRAAVIQSVSRVAVPAEEIDTPLDIVGPVFEVRAAVTGDAVAGDTVVRDKAGSTGQNRPLSPGAVFDADVVSRRRPLYRWLFRAVSPGN